MLVRLLPSRLAYDLQQAALEAKVMEALQCDCVADLRDGVCGTPFTTGVVDRAQRRRRCLSSLTPAYPLFP